MNSLNLNDLPRDATYKLPSLDKSVYLALPVTPANFIPTSKDIVVVEDYQFNIYDKRYRDEEGADMLNVLAGGSLASLQIVYNVKNPMQLPGSLISLKSVHEFFSDEENHYVFPCNRESFGALISIFLVYPEFGIAYKMYLKDPDTNIELKEVYIVPGTESYRQVGKISKTDYQLTAQLLLLLLTKTFKANASGTLAEHIKNYTDNRKKAICSVLSDSDAKYLVTLEGLDKACAIWEELPKLREMIFKLAFRIKSKYPEISTTIQLLAESSMVVLKCMQTFMTADLKSQAHAHITIWKEQKQFMEDCQRKRNELGALWPFYRVISPKNTDLAATHYPNLSRAAVLYYRKFIDTSSTFQKVNVPAHSNIASLDEMATTALDPSYLKRGVFSNMIQSLDESIKQFAEEAGFDLERWSPPNRSRPDHLREDRLYLPRQVGIQDQGYNLNYAQFAAPNPNQGAIPRNQN